MNIRTPENSRRLARMVQGLEPEDRWALIERAEAADSWEELEGRADAAPEAAAAPAEEDGEIDWGNVASEVNLMLELNGQGATASAENQR